VVLSKQGFDNNRIKRTTVKQQQNNEKYFFLLSLKLNNMKVKFIIAATLFLTMVYAGYSVYESTTLTEAEKFMKANVEALTLDEPGGGEGEGPGFFTCYNGGPGAIECSIAAGIDIAGYGVTTGCSIKCKDGYYACCGIHCRCYPD